MNRPAHYKSVQCPTCGGSISGDLGWNGGSSQRYMRQHRRRCEAASDQERAHYVQHGTWPRTRLAKKKRSA